MSGDLLCRQRLLARYLDDPAVEAQVRADPAAAAAAAGVAEEYARWLAGLDEGRVAAFRRSRVHKARRRVGERGG